jgi:peptidoglycan/LPS O-acetylase OafA/YrhL
LGAATLALPEERRRYLVARAARILPLYWLTLFVGLVINWATLNGRNLADLAGNLLFLQTAAGGGAAHWFVPFTQNGPLWSLSYEVFYYLALISIWPRLMIHPSHAQAAFLWTTIGLGIVGVVLNRYAFFCPLFSFLSLWWIWALGFVLADTAMRQRVLQTSVWLALLTVLGVALLGKFVVGSGTLTVWLTGVAVVPIFMSLQRFSALGWNLTPFAYAIKGLAYIGGGSYALYLLNVPVYQLAVRSAFDAWIAVPILIVVTAFLEPRLHRRLKHWLQGKLAS